MLHIEIKQLKKMGFTVSQITKQLKISRQTVYDYLKMSYEEAEEWVTTLSRRLVEKIFAPPSVYLYLTVTGSDEYVSFARIIS